MAWIESHQEIGRHPKTRRAARLLGVSIPAVVGHLHLLWHWCLDFAQDGSLEGYSTDDIAEAALWEGEAGHFVGALYEAGFLRGGTGGNTENEGGSGAGGRTGGGSVGGPDGGTPGGGAPGSGTASGNNGGALEITNWHEYGGRLIEQRRNNAKRQQKWRESQSRGDPELRSGSALRGRPELRSNAELQDHSEFGGGPEHRESPEPIRGKSRGAVHGGDAARGGSTLPSGDVRDGGEVPGDNTIPESRLAAGGDLVFGGDLASGGDAVAGGNAVSYRDLASAGDGAVSGDGESSNAGACGDNVYGDNASGRARDDPRVAACTVSRVTPCVTSQARNTRTVPVQKSNSTEYRRTRFFDDEGDTAHSGGRSEKDEIFSRDAFANPADTTIEEIYAAYPRKSHRRQGIAAARNAVLRIAGGNDRPDWWREAWPPPDPLEWLLARVRLFAASPRGQAPPDGANDYRPYPASWFNAAAYCDDESGWNREVITHGSPRLSPAAAHNEATARRFLERHGITQSDIAQNGIGEQSAFGNRLAENAAGAIPGGTSADGTLRGESSPDGGGDGHIVPHACRSLAAAAGRDLLAGDGGLVVRPPRSARRTIPPSPPPLQRSSRGPRD